MLCQNSIKNNKRGVKSKLEIAMEKHQTWSDVRVCMQTKERRNKKPIWKKNEIDTSLSGPTNESREKVKGFKPMFI